MRANLTWGLITYDERGRKFIGLLGKDGFPRDSFIRFIFFGKGIPRTALVQLFFNGEPQLRPYEGVPLPVAKNLFGERYVITSLPPLMPGDYIEIDLEPTRRKFTVQPQVSVVAEKRPEWPTPHFFVPLFGVARPKKKIGYRQ